MTNKEKERYLVKFDKDFTAKAKFYISIMARYQVSFGNWEDLSQEFKKKCWVGLDKWHKDIAVKGYINSICKNHFADFKRRQKATKRSHDDFIA